MQSSIAEPNVLARQLGLNDWRVGAHRFAAAPTVWAHCLWWVEAVPSFHAQWVIAGVLAGERRENAPVWRKAIMAQGQVVGFINLKDAVVENALNAVPLLGESSSVFLDGIGYRVRTNCMAVSAAEFHFSNPYVAELVTLERVLLAIGAEIAAASGSPELAGIVKQWRKYTTTR